MPAVTVELPESTFKALNLKKVDAARELLLAALIHWYQLGKVSGGRAAEILGVNKMDFYKELAARKIDVLAVDVDQLKRELALG
jgi:predicted HTH domain antitoxin